MECALNESGSQRPAREREVQLLDDDPVAEALGVTGGAGRQRVVTPLEPEPSVECRSAGVENDLNLVDAAMSTRVLFRRFRTQQLRVAEANIPFEDENEHYPYAQAAWFASRRTAVDDYSALRSRATNCSTSSNNSERISSKTLGADRLSARVIPRRYSDRSMRAAVKERSSARPIVSAR